MVIVAGRLAGGARITLDWRYGLCLVLLLFVVVFGFVAQSVPSGAMVGGIRSYFKFVPIFLLPAVYPFTPRQLAVQFGSLLVLIALQSAVTVYQRFWQFANTLSHTGDAMQGTVTTSGVLSLIMLSGIAILIVFYLRKKIGLIPLLAGTALFFLPTTLNESKITLVVLPLVLVLPAFFMPRSNRAIGRLLPVVAIGSFMVLGYFTVYNYFAQSGRSPTLQTLWQERLWTYVFWSADSGEQTEISRLGSIELAFERLSREPITLVFGLGAGNVSDVSLSGFEGEYADYFHRYGVGETQVATLLWEVGLIGLVLYLVFHLIVFRDASLLARSETPAALLGHAWATIVIIMTLAFVYFPVHSTNELGFVFWFYSGVVAAKAAELRRAAQVLPRRNVGSGRLALGRQKDVLVSRV
jgi:hypothetical protein